MSLFRGRIDVYARHWKKEVVKKHLLGQHVIGIYPNKKLKVKIN